MQSNKKSMPEKLFVRNPELPIPKTIVIKGSCDKPNEKSVDKLTKAIDKTSLKPAVKLRPYSSLPKASSVPDAPSKPDFERPKLNSALRIKEQIKSLEGVKPKRIGSKDIVTDVGQLNFRLEKQVFKSLVPLRVESERDIVPKKSFVRKPKDKVPILSDFYTPKTFPEHNIPPPLCPPEMNKIHRDYDGLRLYRTIQTWNNEELF